jgi:hypothetical protein
LKPRRIVGWLLGTIIAASIHLPSGASAQDTAQGANLQVAVPGDSQVLGLVRATLVALSNANTTGNYSVFREVASSSFSQANTPADLAVIFTQLRAQTPDLLSILFVTPEFSEPPSIRSDGLLRAVGSFPVGDRTVEFELLYRPEAGYWRLFGLAVQPVNIAASPQEN